MLHSSKFAPEHRPRPNVSQAAQLPRVSAGRGFAAPSMGNQALLRSEQAANRVAEQAVNSGKGVENFFKSRFGLDMGRRRHPHGSRCGSIRT